MEEVDRLALMVAFMTATGLMVCRMAVVSRLILTGKYTKDSSSTAKRMALASKSGQMVRNMKAIGLLTNKRVRVASPGPMVESTKELLRKEPAMVLEL